jgi:class 3 adenylate cyclase
MEKHDCERIKTIGDACLAVSGMLERNEQHAKNMVKAAMEIRQFLEERNKTSQIQWQIRIGIHSGRVVGGIVEVKKYIYDVFGDTINTTSRMESNSEPMRINVSETTYSLLKDKFTFTTREPVEIKGKGKMQMYFLEG